MTDHGILISTQNNDALNQRDRDTVYTSKFSTLKILQKKALSITTNGSGVGSGGVVHNLGYAPTYYTWRKNTASFSFLDGTSYPNTFTPVPGTYTPWVPFHHTTSVYSDTNRVKIDIQGANTTRYDFVNYLFADQAEVNQKRGLQTDADFGMKVVQAGKNLEHATEQNVALSSEYDTLQYLPGMVANYGNISLPALAGDFADPNPQEGTYVDFIHNLNYPPFFLAYLQSKGEKGDNRYYSLPLGNNILFGGDGTNEAFTGWCDRTRVRITFYKKAQFSRFFPVSFSAEENINIKVYIFTEDLSLP